VRLSLAESEILQIDLPVAVSHTQTSAASSIIHTAIFVQSGLHATYRIPKLCSLSTKCFSRVISVAFTFQRMTEQSLLDVARYSPLGLNDAISTYGQRGTECYLVTTYQYGTLGNYS